MATCTVAVMEPPPRYSPLNDPYHSPAKRFAPDGASVKIITTATTNSQEEDLVAVLRSMPTKVDTSLRHYGIYESILQVYSAVREGRGRLPHFADASTMRNVYQAVFEVTYRELLAHSYFLLCE